MSSSIQRKRHFVSRVVDQQAIVVPIGRDACGARGGEPVRSVYSFNESGTRLWALIEAGKDAAELAESLCADYGLSAGEAARDAEDFLAHLSKEGLIEMPPLGQATSAIRSSS